MNQILNVINDCRTRSEGYLVDNQIAFIPRVNKDQIDYLCYSYFVDGKLHRYIPQGPKCCFKLKYLHFRMRKRRPHKYMSGVHSLIDLVKNNVIYPIALFLNGKFIPWDIIYITLSDEKYYMMVDFAAIPDPIDIESGKHIFYEEYFNLKYAQIVEFPDGCTYISNYENANDDESIMLTFNEKGEYDFFSNKYAIRYSKLDTNMMYTTFSTNRNIDSNTINAYPVLTGVTDIKLTDANVLLFKDGLLSSNPINKIRKAHDADYKTNDGRVNPCIEFVIDDDPLPNIPVVSFRGVCMSIDGGSNPNNARYDACIFINSTYTRSIDNYTRFASESIEMHSVKENNGDKMPEYWNQAVTPFNLEMSRNKKFEDNVTSAINTIYSYNPSIFNNIFKSNTNVFFDEKDYDWLIHNTTPDSILVIPRKHSYMQDEYFLIFINGELYRYRHAGKYVASNYYLPIQNIFEGDSIEIMRFQNINNGTVNIVVEKNEGFKNRVSDLINEDMILFSRETNTDHFEFSEDGLQHFPVDYTIEFNEEGHSKITLKDDFYYGKELVAVSNTRFKHFCYYLKETPNNSTSLAVDLGDKFMYCNDYSKYMVFYNGRKLNSDHYRLTLPVRPTTPFSRFEIYLTFPVAQGDNLDVIYVPAFMKDFVANYDLHEYPDKDTNRYLNSDIVLDKSALTYPLSSKLFMVWINGRKIPESHVTDIDSTRIRINTDEKSIYNVCITKYTPDIDTLCKAFTDNESLWDKITSSFNLDDIVSILGIDNVNISNTEQNIYAGAVNIKAIMYELIREHYISNETINISEGFLYDYADVDTSIMLTSTDEDGNAVPVVDEGGNTILEVQDSDATDNLNNVIRPFP